MSAKDINLDSRQQQESNHFGKARSYQKVELERYELGSVLYSVGNYVKIGEAFGEISDLFILDGEKWCDVIMIKEFSQDEITGIKYANVNQIKNKKMHRLSHLSRPLVTAEENGNIWFISDISLSLSWFDEHYNATY